MKIEQAFDLIEAKVGSEGSEEDRQLGLAAITILRQLVTDIHLVAHGSRLDSDHADGEHGSAFDRSNRDVIGSHVKNDVIR